MCTRHRKVRPCVRGIEKSDRTRHNFFAGGCPHASAYINGACMPIIRSGWMKGGILMVGIPTDQSFFCSANRLHEKKKDYNTCPTRTINVLVCCRTLNGYTRMMPAGLGIILVSFFSASGRLSCKSSPSG
jgi:hypothetical protein